MSLNSSMAWDLYTEVPPQVATNDVAALVHISSEAEAKAVRQRVIDYFWPQGGLPTAKLPAVSNVYAGQGIFPPEISGIHMGRVARVEKLDVHVDYGYHHVSYLVCPASPTQSARLAIVHQGHQAGLKDGIGDLADYLIGRGFNVLLMQMPLVGWNTDKTFHTPSGVVTIEQRSDPGHDQLVAALEGKGGSALRFFIEPVVAGVNYFVKCAPKHKGICMIGLSGGGWTTHLAAALDPRIDLSIPVAGSYPLYLCPYYPGSKGDAEQELPALYKERASWLDLYILGGYGKGRNQIQLLNQFDSLCFYGVGSETYKDIVRRAVAHLALGRWQCVLDSSHRKHQISTWAIKEVIGPALDEFIRTESAKPDMVKPAAKCSPQQAGSNATPVRPRGRGLTGAVHPHRSETERAICGIQLRESQR